MSDIRRTVNSLNQLINKSISDDPSSWLHQTYSRMPNKGWTVIDWMHQDGITPCCLHSTWINSRLLCSFLSQTSFVYLNRFDDLGRKHIPRVRCWMKKSCALHMRSNNHCVSVEDITLYNRSTVFYKRKREWLTGR